MAQLPRYVRRSMRAQGAGSARKRPVRQLVYQAVAMRCQGRCELCGHAWEAQTGLRLDPHHAFGRGSLPGIPVAFCESADLVLGVCRSCHDRIHTGDGELADKARYLALSQFCLRWDLELPELMEEAGSDLVDIMRLAIRRLEERA